MAVDALVFATGWIDAFNTHDLARILAHYHGAVELTSPVYQRYTHGRTDTCRGIADLAQYFGDGLRTFPDMRFRHLETYVGSGSVCVRYHTTVGDRVACETMAYDADGLVRRVLAHYA